VALSPGTPLGPYEVLGSIGEGGMGQVYRARDTKLDRDVALKVLPESFASDPERLRRFEREAKTLASLNHANIAQIYGIVDADGRQAIVMELVAGRTLDAVIQADADRWGTGVPVTDAVAIASQIAEALETAHEAGIVHRDLKPANVMVRDDGVVKVLDFGLARPADTTAAAFSSPTMLSPAMTGHGVILGTASYMSPEQAKGRPADKRSDIWAFGVVLHEMLTGKPLFGGETVTEVIAAVLKDTPNLDAVPASTPLALRRLLERCLERDPRLRLRDIGEARIALARLYGATADGPTGQNAPDRTRRSPIRALAYALGTVAVAAAAGVAAWIAKPGGTPVPIRRFELPRPIAESSSFALAPDGSRIAYVHRGHLYVHALDSGIANDLVAIPPSANTVFWSPDSRTIGLTVDASLKTIPASGGALFTVCKVPASGLVMTSRWQPDNTILFAVWRDSLYRVSASGGTPELHAAIDAATEVDFHSIATLPGNRLAVTTHVRGDDGARLDVIAGGRRTPLASTRDINSVRFQSPDKLLFLRIGVNAGVWVAPLAASVDLTRATLLEPGAIDFDAATDGTLVAYFLPKDRRELIWVTRRGEITALAGLPFETGTGDIALSPDHRRAVLSVRAADLTAHFVVRDLTTGSDTPIPAPEAVTVMTSSATVSWTPAQRLLYAAGGIESWRIHDWPSDGSTGGRVLADGLGAVMVADGSQVLFLRDERGATRLFRAPVKTDGSLGPAAPVFGERDGQRVRTFDVSPDGRLLAFTTTNSDTQQLNVILTTLPDLGERRQVTSSGGNRPRFSRDGRELYFLSGQRDSAGRTRGQLNVVSIRTSPLTIGVPETVLEAGENGRPAISGFDIAADGRLLMTRKAPAAPGDEGRAVLRQNWMAAITK
jgi:predicted Ser/Thr protein kinase